MEHSQCGIVMVGVNYTADANILRTAKSIKKHMPDLSITAFTDQHTIYSPYVDNVVYIPSRSSEPCLRDKSSYPDQGIAAKMTYMNKANYEYTIYLDYDIWVTDSLWEVYETMENGKFDLIVVPVEYLPNNRINTSRCFPYYNAGMIAWHKCEATDLFFKYWWDAYIADSCKGIGCSDEKTLVESLYNFHGLRFLSLTSEYNYRDNFPGMAGSKIKIIHGVPGEYKDDISKLDAKINGERSNTCRMIYKDKILATYTIDKQFERF